MEKLIDLLGKNYRNKEWFLFLEELLCRYNDDGVSEIGAQLTYYLILAVFPFLIFFLSLLKFTPLADTHVLERMLMVLPGETQKILYNLITEILTKSNMTLLSFGAIGAIWSSSNGIMAIIKSINRAFDLKEDRPYWKLRALSIIFTIGLFIILIITFSVLIFGEVFFNIAVGSYTWTNLIMWKVLKVLIPLIFMILMFSILYKFSPSIKEGINIKFRDTITGSIFASLGLVIFSVIFSFYINNFGNYTKTYGSIGGIIILLVWLYSSSIVVVLGAEVNASLMSMHKSKIESRRLKVE